MVWIRQARFYIKIGSNTMNWNRVWMNWIHFLWTDFVFHICTFIFVLFLFAAWIWWKTLTWICSRLDWNEEETSSNNLPDFYFFLNAYNSHQYWIELGWKNEVAFCKVVLLFTFGCSNQFLVNNSSARIHYYIPMSTSLSCILCVF